MRGIPTLAGMLPCLAVRSAAVLAAAMLAGCAAEAPLTAGPETSASLVAASVDPAEAAENAELAATATEVPVVAAGPRLDCRREIPIGSRIGHTVCTMVGGPPTAADELQRIHTDYELEENRLYELINLGIEDDEQTAQ